MTVFEADRSAGDAVALILDKQAIHEALLRYCRGVDRLDEELVRGAYWPDGWDDHGLFSGERDAFVDWVIDYLRTTMTRTVHILGNNLIELRGALAFSECCFLGFYDYEKDGQEQQRVSCGRYIDRFEKRGQEWRISRRTVVNDWGRSAAVEAPAQLRLPGQRSLDDPVYALRASYLA